MKKQLLLLSLLIPISIYSQQLDLDTSYADQGINTTGLQNSNTYHNGISGISNVSYLMPDNSFLVPYSIHPNFNINYPTLSATIGIKKYLEDGSLDMNFGTDGTALLTAAAASYRFTIFGIAVQPDGKILLSGQKSYLSYTSKAPFICRINADGTLDTTFGTNGYVIQNYLYIGSTDDTVDRRFSDLTVDSQDRIIAVGYVRGNTASKATAVAIRYLSDGTLDTSFANDGILQLSMMSGWDEFSQIYPVEDNHFILLGSTTAESDDSSDFLVAKIDDNGSFDPTFGTEGIVQIDFDLNEYASEIFFQPDGKMLVAGHRANTGLAFAKLNTDGSLDTTFGNEGKNTTSIPVPGYYGIGSEVYPRIGAQHIARLPDNKYIIASTIRTGNTYDYAIARLNEDTTLDYDFMSNGVYSNGIAAFDWARSVHVQNDGKLLVLVNSTIFKYLNFSTLRLDNINTDKMLFQAYPNPTSDIVNLNVFAQTVTINDLTGKTIAVYNNVERIDLSGYTKGVYLITVTQENGTKQMQKIVKK